MPKEASIYRVENWDEIDRTMRERRTLGFAELEVGKPLEDFRLVANLARHATREQQLAEHHRWGDGSIEPALWAVRRFWSSVLRTYLPVPDGDRSQD